MRTFIAAEIPVTTEIKNLITDLQKNLKGVELKYTNLNNYHITLAFLGETTENQIKSVCKELSSIRPINQQIEISVAGLGVFKDGQHPSVLWLGLKPNRVLEELHRTINQIVESLGFKIDHRPFAPHLTVGRVKKADSDHNLSYFISHYEKCEFAKILIPGVVYFQSQLTSQGPIYKPIQKFKL